MIAKLLTALACTALLASCDAVGTNAENPAIDAEPSLDAVEPQAIEAHLRFLSDDLLEGRGTGTRGHDLAAKYMAAQFQALGLLPRGEDGTYLQYVPFRETRPVEGSARLTLSRGGETIDLVEGEHFIVGSDPIRMRTDVTAPVVFAGFGVTASELGYDDYAGLDVTGTIVAILNNTPATFPNDQRAYYSSTRVKSETAAAHGAVGMILIQRPEDEKRLSWARMVEGRYRASLRWLEESGAPHGVNSAIRAVARLSQEGAAILFEGAPASRDEVFAQAKEGTPPAFALEVTAMIQGESRHDGLTSANVAAVLPGSDPDLADEYVVFSAHIDHLGIATPVNDDNIYNGAYDNASGSALLLEIAKGLAAADPRPRRSILFLAVTGEEKGLRGSDYFATNATVAAGSMVADINLDMLHMLHPLNDIIAFGGEHSSLGLDVEVAASAMGVAVSPDPFPELVVFIRSDHYSFVRQGVPAISLFPGFVTGDPDIDGEKLFEEWMATTYHRPNDDMSQPFDFDAGVKFAKIYILMGIRVANADDRPTWNEGDFFGDKFGRAEKRAGSP